MSDPSLSGDTGIGAEDPVPTTEAVPQEKQWALARRVAPLVNQRRAGTLNRRLVATAIPETAPLAIGARGTKFWVTEFDLKIKAEPLEVTNEYGEPGDQDLAQDQLASKGIEFTATVLMDPAEPKWVAGWIQNVYPFLGITEYKRPGRDGTLRVECKLGEQMRDGEASGDPLWYEKGAFRVSTAKVAMTDEPNLPFHKPEYVGCLVEADNWQVHSASGAKRFCTWLAAKDPTTGEIIRLKYVKWEVDFASSAVGTGEELTLRTTTGGTRLTEQADGPGEEPILDKGVDEDTMVWSAELQA
jgi:hypothetical protein